MIGAAKSPPAPGAQRVLHAMPGGAQSQLVQADDGHLYVVKFSNNPQHRRTLINEVVAGTILHALGLPAAQFSPIGFSEALLHDQPIPLQFGSHHALVSPGLHFGSRLPDGKLGNRAAVYDTLPSSILRGLDLDAFGGVYVADQ